MNAELNLGFAAVDDIRHAIEALSVADRTRLKAAARTCLPGSEYKGLEDLLNEAVLRTLRAAQGEDGRRWRKDVEFLAHVIMTMKGLADDSRKSVYVKKTKAAAAADGRLAEEALGAQGHAHPDFVTQVVDAEERAEAADQAKADLEKIDAHFADDPEVQWLLMGHKDNLSAADVRELSGMDPVTYATARRRFRRGLNKLFPDRSQK